MDSIRRREAFTRHSLRSSRGVAHGQTIGCPPGAGHRKLPRRTVGALRHRHRLRYGPPRFSWPLCSLSDTTVEFARVDSEARYAAHVPASLVSTFRRKRSHAMFSLIGTLLVGLVVGLLARALKPGDDKLGWIMTSLLGVAGSFLATYVGVAMGWYQQGEAAGVDRLHRRRHRPAGDLRNGAQQILNRRDQARTWPASFPLLPVMPSRRVARRHHRMPMPWPGAIRRWNPLCGAAASFSTAAPSWPPRPASSLFPGSTGPWMPPC